MAEGNGNGTARWQLWVSLVGVGVILLGSMMTLYVQVNTAYTTANELQARVDRLSAQVTDDRSRLAIVCADLVEVETQFRASDQVRNLMQANNLRIESILWQKEFGSPYPAENPYLPTIAQDQPTPCR